MKASKLLGCLLILSACATQKELRPAYKTLNIVFGGENGAGKLRYMNAKATFYTATHDGMPVITMYIDKGDSTLRTNRQGTAWQLSVRCVEDAHQ